MPSNDKALYRFVKASERLPEKENSEYGGKYVIRYFSLSEIHLWTKYEVEEHGNAGYAFEWLEKVEADQQEVERVVTEILKDTWTTSRVLGKLEERFIIIPKQ